MTRRGDRKITADAILEGYSEASAELIPRFEAISPADLYAPVAAALPEAPSRIADVGAGTGRDAAWLAGLGHEIVAVEPVAALREAGMRLHDDPAIVWLDDRLPALVRLRALDLGFDRVMLSGVWQHLDADEQAQAMPNLAALVARGGKLILSLRHGPGAAGRRCYPAMPEQVIASALGCGLVPELRLERPSVQAENRRKGVTWTWLVFRRSPGRTPMPGESGERMKRRGER